jgi:hypothetical protein
MEESQMKNTISFAMIVIGVGALVFGVSDYSPGSGWADSCRYVMAIGSMSITGGWLTR